MKKIVLALAVMASGAFAEDVKVEAGTDAAAAPATEAAPVAGDAVAIETAELGGSVIALHLQAFLTEPELATLRVVMTNEEALKLFVPSGAGFAALAVSPEDGFMKDGALVPSAIAISDLPDAAAAAKAATEACDAAKKGASACVIVLEIGPKQ